MGTLSPGVALEAWVRGARLPFQLVGLLPFGAGLLFAFSEKYPFRAFPFLVGLLAVFLVMLATYFLGEYFDQETDRVNQDYNRFSGGTRALYEFNFKAKNFLWAGWGAAAGAVFLGLLLFFRYQLGFPGLLLGTVGWLSGIFYSTPPGRWAYRGIGEFLIGFCYGWLTLNMGYYLFAHSFNLLGTILSLPVVLSIMAVIVINEFPDVEADRAVGKNNLVVACGREKVSSFYLSLLLGTVVAAILSWGLLGKSLVLVLLLAGVLLALVWENLRAVWYREYYQHQRLEKICGLTLVLNLFINLSYIFILGTKLLLG